jgi:PIN domain nuclease of toxin-antitoxin system
MKLHLGTIVWLWALLEPDRLSATVRAALQAPGNESWLLPISVSEAMRLVERARLKVCEPANVWVEQMLRVPPKREAPLTYEIARVSRQLTLTHQDPADRLLAATAANSTPPFINSPLHATSVGDAS